MKPRLVAVRALATTCLMWSSLPAALADPPKEADLLKRIEQLERRVAELEKRVPERPSGKESATETERKLVGNWTITDADKKAAADKRVYPATDLTMKADGTCAMVAHDNSLYPNGKYQLTAVGSVTQLYLDCTIPAIPGASTGWALRVASVTDKELVLEYPELLEGKPGEWVKVHYTRTK